MQKNIDYCSFKGWVHPKYSTLSQIYFHLASQIAVVLFTLLVWREKFNEDVSRPTNKTKTMEANEIFFLHINQLWKLLYRDNYYINTSLFQQQDKTRSWIKMLHLTFVSAHITHYEGKFIPAMNERKHIFRAATLQLVIWHRVSVYDRWGENSPANTSRDIYI